MKRGVIQLYIFGLLKGHVQAYFFCEIQIDLSRAMRKCVMSYANNKGADPAHPRSLISAFVVRCLDSIISLEYSRNLKTT